MPWKKRTWVDDDGSLTVGTEFDAEKMNNIELGIGEDHDQALAASGIAGSALIQASSGVTAAGSALKTGQDARQVAGSALFVGQGAQSLAISAIGGAASGINAAKLALDNAGSALVTGQDANVRAASGVTAAGSALVTGQQANARAASGVAAAGSGLTGVTNLLNNIAAAGMGVAIHGAAANTKRPSGFDVVMWIGTVEPANALESDPWINPEDFGVNSPTFIPVARAYRTTNQSIAASIFSEMLLDKTDHDNAAIHSTTTNTGRLTAPKAGVYLVTFQFALFTGTSSTTGIDMAVLQKNGTNYNMVRYGMEPNGEAVVQISAQVKLDAGDYMTCLAYNPSASAPNISSGEGTMVYLGTGTPSLTPVDWGLVTELPAAAGVGDTCELKVRETESSPWKVWECVKVESSGERPWAKKGGPALLAKTAPGTSSASSYGTTSIPKLSYPFNGDYRVTFGCDKSIRNNIATDSGFLRTAYFSNGVQVEENIGRLGGNGGETMSTEIDHTARVKGQQADTRFKNDGGNSTVWEGLFIKIDATRLG